MVDNLPFVHAANPFSFRHKLEVPLSRVVSARLVSMTMDYPRYAVFVSVDELHMQIPVFVDKSLDSPLLLAPHLAYERRFRGAPLDHLAALTISIAGCDGSVPEATILERNRVTMLFSIEHDAAEAEDDDGLRRNWVVVENAHALSTAPFAFAWDGPPHGAIPNVRRIALKAMIMSIYASYEPYVRLNVPELGLRDWPIPFTSDSIGTYFPYALMHMCPEYELNYHPPMCALGRLSVDITHGSGGAIEWGRLLDRRVFLLLEVDSQAIPAAAAVYRPIRPAGRLLVVDNLRHIETSPFAFRCTLDEPCRAVNKLILQMLVCPHPVEGAFVRLSLRNLGVQWVVPYSQWFYREQPNVLTALPNLHCADLNGAALTRLDVELEAMDPRTGDYRPFVPAPGTTSLAVCLSIRVLLGEQPT